MDALLIIKDITSTQWLLLLPLLPVFFITLFVKWYQWKNKKIIEMAVKLPVPTSTHIFLGTWYNSERLFPYPVYTGEDFTKVSVVNMRKAAVQPYSVYCLWVGPVPQIFIQKPHDAQIILTSSKALDKSNDYKFARFAFGDGLVTAPGVKWKISRRYLNQIFHQKNLNLLTTVFNQSARQLVNDLVHHANGELFDVSPAVFNATNFSIYNILFGLQTQSSIENGGWRLGASIALRITAYTGERTFRPWLWSDRAFNFFYKKKLEDLEETWIRYKSQSNVIENSEFLAVPSAYSKILEEHATSFSKADLEAELKTILSAGSDTTALTLCSCLLLLGTHLDIQEKLHDEVIQVLGPEDRDVSVEDLNSLPYLDQVIKETLRMATVIIAFKRTLIEDIKLSECTIPKGGSVIISVVGLHFDPEVYPEPYVFKPERFTPENSAKRHPYSFLPFAGGPRNCIGKQYAMTSIKIMLAQILRRYKISAQDNVLQLRRVFTITFRSIEGYKISLESRMQ